MTAPAALAMTWLLTLAVCPRQASAPRTRPALELQAAEVIGDGGTVEAEYGFLSVPQFHDDPAAGELELAVLVRRSTAAEPGPPIFFLNGIPEGATDRAADECWDDYLELGDLVLFDQRGSGRSRPQLTWDRPPYRAELFLSTRAAALQNLLATAETIRAFTDDAGVQLSAFNTRESARDVEALRAALGYESMRLIGHSGGTHLGLEVLRRFGDRVVRFVSLGTAGPNDIHSLPSELDAFLRQLSELAAADARIGAEMPDLFQRTERILAAVEREPLSFDVRHPETGEQVELRLGRQGLQLVLVLELGDPEDLALFPRLVYELENGRTDVLRWFVELRYEQLTEFPALLFVNRGASGATPERWERIYSEAPASPFGLVRCLFSPELDRAFGIVDLGDGFRSPVESDVPALFVSATLDGKTPPERAESARQGFSRSAHVILENAGHNDLVDHPEAHRRVIRFLSGEELDDERIAALPPIRFALLAGDDPLVEHPALE
jgi:pimeloyl-ACP methyl ester carboxylesterase